MILHKIPEVLALSAVFLSSHWSKKKTILGLALFALINSIGVLLSSVPFEVSFLNVLVGISGGTFIYIAAVDLIPSILRVRAHRWWNLVFFLIGAALLSQEFSWLS